MVESRTDASVRSNLYKIIPVSYRYSYIFRGKTITAQLLESKMKYLAYSRVAGQTAFSLIRGREKRPILIATSASV